MILKGESAEEFNRKADENYEKLKARQKQNLIDMMKADEKLGLYEQPIAEDAKVERPKDEDFRNNPSGTLTYLFALEKYVDHLEIQDNGLREAAEKLVKEFNTNGFNVEVYNQLIELEKALKQ
jgi:hypothetical protein